ncbi:MAG TPA: dienelactone hydrolase family protein [Candidatus Limnocylindrales bacterium]|nr:dienelactone hydrolase family protein [Candidatus Limnocylindrales bacterium]
MRDLHLVVAAALLAACSGGQEAPPAEMSDPDGGFTSSAPVDEIPAGAAEAQARLAASPRHAEWVTVRSGQDSVRAWVVYPERGDPAPVVLVVHEIFGLSHWVRAVADQFAADGFIAIAPDMLTMRNIPPGPDGAPDPDVARSEIQTVDRDALHRQLLAVAEYGMSLPAAQESYGIVGYCWGGAVAFEHAARSPSLGASVVYYGTSPDSAQIVNVQAPVLGLYGENDERVNATIEPAQQVMAGLASEYDPRIYPGAGHGFLRAQDGQDGANLAATREAWPATIAFFRQHLE